jgi:serine phosphatase RsbU (regulator of sigma subunit)/anti-sigma regulatory factor (Ser/Thr protein kinase)
MPVRPPVPLAPDDPLLAYFQRFPVPAEVARLPIDSPGRAALQAAGVTLVVPLVNQGEVVALLNLGPRRSHQPYSTDDRALLADLAAQAGPAVRVTQLARQQQVQARARERLEHELRVARIIQQTLLPKQTPDLPGYVFGAVYRPARAVGGDFFDFVRRPDGRLVVIVGDVTDKGVPAALMMATVRGTLRGSAQRLESPGAVLARVNDLVCPEMPRAMFITCLVALLDPATGRLTLANAGHCLPYRRRHAGGTVPIHATGMPLGLLPGIGYDDVVAMVEPGDTLVLYSDGMVEAHNPAGQMVGFDGLAERVAAHPGGPALKDHLLAELAAFTGPGWEQEDDVTLVVMQREPLPEGAWQILATFSWPSEPGNERLAMAQVAEAVAGLGLAPARLEQLKTAVAEATMNAMEHAHHFRPELEVDFEVRACTQAVEVRITDLGGEMPIPPAELPDLDAKLAGQQSPRGWGLFLIEQMVDSMSVDTQGAARTLTLRLNRTEHAHGD